MRAPGKRAREVIAYAESLGFRTSFTRHNHLKFTCPGCRPVFTSGTPGDVRSLHNARALLRRSLRGDL